MNSLNKREGWIAGGSVVATLVISLVIAHVRDSDRDAQLVRAHQTIAADSTLRTAAVATTTAAAVRLDTASAAAARVDTIWRRAAATSLARIDTVILSKQLPDTAKIRILAQDDTALIVAGNALADTTQQLRAAAVNFRATVDVERAAWTNERRDLSSALATSEARHRHWGFGFTGGAAVVRDATGIIRAGPGVTLGITYRW